MDNEDNKCYPSLQTIAEESGISVPTIRASIKRLEKEQYITTEKIGRKIYYFFNPYKTFEPFSDEFLKRKDLSPLTKSYLVAIQQYMYKDIEGLGKISMSNYEIAKKIKTSEHTVRKCNKELERKNYLTVVTNESRDLETGCKTNTKIYNLFKLGQAIIWTLNDHEDRLEYLEKSNQEKDKLIEKLTERVSKLEQKEPNEFIM